MSMKEALEARARTILATVRVDPVTEPVAIRFGRDYPLTFAS